MSDHAARPMRVFGVILMAFAMVSLGCALAAVAVWEAAR